MAAGSAADEASTPTHGSVRDQQTMPARLAVDGDRADWLSPPSSPQPGSHPFFDESEHKKKPNGTAIAMPPRALLPLDNLALG